MASRERYRVGRASLIFHAVGAVASAAVALFVVLPTVIDPTRPGPPRWISVLWIGGIVYLWFVYLRAPFEIALLTDGRMEFRGLLRRVSLLPGEIEAITTSFWANQYITFRYRGGKITMPRDIPGLFDLLTELKKLNPQIRLHGM